VGLSGRDESLLHPQVDDGAGACEPTAAAGGEQFWLVYFDQAQQSAVKTSRLIFTPRRHSQLDVVQADDHVVTPRFTV
jgi:hypothetical protein